MNLLVFVLLFILIENAELTKAPNILLFLADDQDVVLKGMEPMKAVTRLLGKEGATFTHAYTSSPICCPSRASLLSGLYPHNHHTINNSASGGCYGSFWQNKIEPSALPVVLQKNNYRTFYAGKYLNEYFDQKVPPGWTEFHGLHGNSRYYNYSLNQNGQVNHFTDLYLTDHLKNLTLDFLDRHKDNENQAFFGMIGLPAAHAPFTPAPRHKGKYNGLKALRTPNFNLKANSLDKHWLVSSAKKMDNATISLVDQLFQDKYETLLAVDEFVKEVVDKLESLKLLDSTYVIYTSDNGYHVGQFALPFDKRLPYETDIQVPLLVRGPNVPKNLKISVPVGLIDIYPTILEWTNLPLEEKLDGLSFNVYIENGLYYEPLKDPNYHRSLLIEYWGEGNDATYNPQCPQRRADHLAGCTVSTDCHCQDSWNNTYACVRHLRYRTDRLYCEFRDQENFIEAYDLLEDPYQIDNIINDLLPIEQALYNLALANLTKCSGSSCNDILI